MCLEEAGVTDADAIIIGPADDLDPKEVQLVQSLLSSRGIRDFIHSY